MKHFEIPGETHTIEAVHSEVSDAIGLLIIAHGAGAGMNHSFMENLSENLNENRIDVIRFNFPYITLGKKFPSSPKPNIQAWNDVIAWSANNIQLPIFIGGKSYGGRMASHLLAGEEVKEVNGIIYFGFPLHAPGKDSTDRAKHLDKIKVPQLFIQGNRDALAKFGLIQEVIEHLPSSTLEEISGGDHSFKVKGLKPNEVIERIARVTSNWIENII